MLNDKDKQKLNDYLSQIEEHLKQISVSERSDIILELDSHIKESLSTSDQTVGQLIRALGEPSQVANRYLLSKGAKPIPPRRWTWLKVLSLSFVSLFAIVVIGTVVLIKSFTPIISVNEKTNEVKLFGGLIDIDGLDEDEFYSGNVSYSDDDMEVNLRTFKEKIKGSIQIDKQKKLVVTGQNGKWNFEPSEGKSFSYKCRIKGLRSGFSKEQIISQSKMGEIKFDLGNNILTGAKCDFNVPKELSIAADLGNGKIELEKLAQDISAKVNNGKIKFEKSPQTAYNFNANVTAGTIKGLNDIISDQNGHNVDLEVVNGKISVD